MLDRRVLSSFLLVFLCLLIPYVNAQSLSPQQVNQFKRLPVQQQRALAQQMGVDYSQVQAQLSGSAGKSSGAIDTSKNSVYPRGTEFDQYGNPTSYGDSVEKFLEIKSQSLKPYGYNLFAGSPSTFAPVTDTPVPANYLLGVGDTLEIQIYGKENLNHSLQVDREGMLAIPQMQPIKVAGLTFTEAKSFISSQISKMLLGVQSHVSMGELRSMRIFVLGEAFKPGAYTVSSLTTMTQALFLSGGVNEIASLRNIQLKRAGKTISTLDLYDLLNFGDTKDDELLQPGDVLFIPTIESSVTVKGNVRRPAIYELKGETSFLEVIELAGGFANNAYKGVLNVKRFETGAITQVTIAQQDMKNQVVPGDVIEVSGVSDSLDSAVTLVGAVARPGPVQWYEGVRLSDLISNRKKDLLAEVDLDYGLVLRNYQTGVNLEILQFQPSELLAKNSDHDFSLEQEDIVVFFSQVESEGLGKTDIEDLALSKRKLEEREKAEWKKRIEQRMFWQQIGFDYDSRGGEEQPGVASGVGVTEPIIKLTQLEADSLNRVRDTTAYSRTRLLGPIIAKLRVHSSFDNPLKLIEISGAVQYPGLYPLPDNGSLKEVFLAAGGLSESAYYKASEITRYSHDTGGDLQVQNIQFSPREVMSGAKLVSLNSRDRINVFRNPEWQEQLSVELRGEVVFPGKYTIRRGETLNRVIERAGGLTKYADANASVFLRESLRRQEAANLRRLTEDLRKEIASESLRRNSSAGALVSYGEVQQLLRDLTKVKALGRLVIDLPAIMQDNAQDFPLEDQDVLVIPGVNKTVNVIGEVFVPTSHLYDKGVSFDTYIKLSGGFKDFANQERTYIIKANGGVVIPQTDSSFWYQSDSKTEYSISPGDTIVVPFDSGHVDQMTLWTSASQILYQFAVTVAAVGSL